MVQQDFLDNLLWNLRQVAHNSLEREIGWSKNGVIRFGTVKQGHKIFVLINELGEIGGIV